MHAYLVVPPGKGSFPALIWAHGSGGSRTDLLLAATWLAARRAVGFVVDDPFERDPSLLTASDARQRAAIVQEVVDLRRSVYVLRSLPYVDRKRIGFAGLSLGARAGALLAGAEPRINAFDFQSGRGASFGPGLDELTWIKRSHARFYLQAGVHDVVVPHAELVALIEAAPDPKKVSWYAAGHVPSAAEVSDQLRWLAHELGLGGPVVRGAVAGP